MQRQMVSTVELVKFLQANKYLYFNISVILNYGLLATHIISMRKNQIWDEGIDAISIKWLPEEFLEHYKNATWIIN
jgi:hypothetical protein